MNKDNFSEFYTSHILSELPPVERHNCTVGRQIRSVGRQICNVGRSFAMPLGSSGNLQLPLSKPFTLHCSWYQLIKEKIENIEEILVSGVGCRIANSAAFRAALQMTAHRGRTKNVKQFSHFL